METLIENGSERCISTSMTRREASAEPSEKDVAEPDQIASGTAGTGQENNELEWARRHVPPDPYLAERKTEIIGWGIPPRNKVRRKPSGTSPEEGTGTT